MKSALSARLIPALARVVAFFAPLRVLWRRDTSKKARIRARDAELLRHALPRLPQRFAAAREEEALLELLAGFAEEADLCSVELLAGDGIAYRWSSQKRALADAEAASSSSPPRDHVTARFPIGRAGRARSEVCFEWVSPDSQVSPESDILLQVATDVLEANLTRLRSRLAPLSAAVIPELPAPRAEEALARRIG